MYAYIIIRLILNSPEKLEQYEKILIQIMDRKTHYSKVTVYIKKIMTQW